MSRKIVTTPHVRAERIAIWIFYSPLSERISEKITRRFWFDGHDPKREFMTDEEWEEITSVFHGPKFLHKPVDALVSFLERRSSKTTNRWVRRKINKNKCPNKIWKRH